MRIFSKRLTGLIGLGVASGLVLGAVAHAVVAFGPPRATFTWAHPAPYITFDSITDNPDPSIGDERYFVSARDLASSDKLTYSKSVNVTDNEELLVRVFYHNDAGANLNLVAQNTKVRVNVPTANSTSMHSTAFITADNANPNEVWSSMDFTGSQAFTLAYEPGSAQIWNQKLTGAAISDNVVGSGALIGFDKIDGKIPGCSEFSGFVTIKVRVHMPTTPQPVYSCNLLTVTPDTSDSHKYNGSVTYTAQNGASLTNVSWNWGDGSSADNTGTTTTDSHTYGKDGTFTVVSTLTFNVGGTNKTAECSKSITITTPPTTPPVTPPVTPAPTKLPNTGPGSVIGIFAGVSTLAGAAHYIFSGRRVRG